MQLGKTFTFVALVAAQTNVVLAIYECYVSLKINGIEHYKPEGRMEFPGATTVYDIGGYGTVVIVIGDTCEPIYKTELKLPQAFDFSSRIFKKRKQSEGQPSGREEVKHQRIEAQEWKPGNV